MFTLFWFGDVGIELRARSSTAIVLGKMCLCASYRLFPCDKALVHVDKGLCVTSVCKILTGFAPLIDNA